jgi:phosphoribosylformimino-5-aminoimidazole carboxamide ribotide isomerase
MTSCNVIASGGVSRAGDVARLCELNLPNLEGVIVGKALYDGAVTMSELKAAARQTTRP